MSRPAGPLVKSSNRNVIRPASLDDAATIASIHVRGWQQAYADILPRAFLDSLSIEKRTDRWRGILGRQRTGETLVYVEHDTVLGWLDWGTSRDADRAGEAEILAVYVAPTHWHRGIGKQLMQRTEDGIVTRAIARATLWVLEQNIPGRRFYERIGYTHEGARKSEVIGDTNAVELRYAKSLHRAERTIRGVAS